MAFLFSLLFTTYHIEGNSEIHNVITKKNRNPMGPALVWDQVSPFLTGWYYQEFIIKKRVSNFHMPHQKISPVSTVRLNGFL